MTLTLNTDGLRLDAALAALLPELSRSAVQRLLEDGAVTLDGRPVKKNAKLPAGTVLNVEIPEAKPTENPAQDIPLDVVYEDDDVIVVNKPKGLVVHPAPGHPDGTLVNALIHHCGDSLSGVGGEKRPGIVHRIDKDTSGLLIAAKNDFAHAHLAAQLKDHSLARTYECIVCGNLREDFVLAIEHVHLCPAVLLRVGTVGGGANHTTRQDSLLSQRLGSIATGQVVQGSVVVEEGLPRAGDEQVARRGVRNSLGRVFR